MIPFLLQFLPPLVVVTLLAIVAVSLVIWFARRLGQLCDLLVALSRAWAVYFILAHIYLDEPRYRAFKKFLDENEAIIRKELKREGYNA